MPQKTHIIHRVVTEAYCDPHHQARLSWMLAAAQQISMEHCTSAGIGGSYFRDRGLVFLLAKLHLDIYRIPSGGEEVELFTQPNLPHRAQFRRATRFTATDGSLLAEMDARWVLVDIASRQILRRLPADISLPFLDAEPLPDLRPALPAGELQRCDEVPVRYSMLDINGHVNNAVYGDLVCNLLEGRLLAGERLRSVDIFYHREALPGSTITLYKQEEGNRFFVRGSVGDSVCFEACGQLE